MTCEEFERVLPELEGNYTIEQEEHVRACFACSDLVSDLNAVSQTARLLQAATEEPSPRVWNSIELALRQEGLIRQPPPYLRRSPRRAAGWKLAWLAPAFAALLLASGLLLHRHGRSQAPSGQELAVAPAASLSLQSRPLAGMVQDEEQLLQAVAARAPALRAAYESDLRAVDAYIRDAEQSARSDPNDEIAQQYLMNAYEQRAMVYEMALDRALP